jgi:hypothetical protein
MKSTEHFKRVIQQYLENRAKTDALFATTFANPEKNIDACITYILNQVQKSRCNGFEDNEIYSMAVHYYDEKEIDIGNEIECTIITNHKIELTPDEIEEAKAEAKKKLINEEYNSLKKKPTTKHTETKPENLQLSLF